MTVFGEAYSSAYDYLYHDKDYEKECNFLEALFGKHRLKAGTILDLGCGTGGHDLILARRGHRVTGVDRSQEMLDIAISKATKERLKLEFVRGDITDIDLDRKFDAVISMFAVMSYQTTNLALSNACKTAARHLALGGVFIFDCWHGPAVLTERPTPRIKEISLDEKGKIIRFTEPVLNILNHTVEARFKVWKIRDGYPVDETNETHLMRFIFPQEIRYFLEAAGFSDVEFYPFLDMERALTEHDWNMTVVARR